MQCTRRQMLAFSGLTALSACGGRSIGRHGAPNIIIFLSDALRADHLGCYGHRAAATPHLDAFSREAFVFERCYSQCNWTKPSVASLFTGQSPAVHRNAITHAASAVDETSQGTAFRPDTPLLPEILGRGGYDTVAFSANPHIRDTFGFARGFDRFTFQPGLSPREQIKDVLTWLHMSSGPPFFGYVHVIDPHGPYRPDERHLGAVTRSLDLPSLASLPESDQRLLSDFDSFYDRQDAGERVRNPDLTGLTSAAVRYIKQLYDGEINGVDEQFGRMLRILERRKLLDSTVIAVTSDHGESFGEHGCFGHGSSLFREQLHVPLLIRVPGREGARIPWTISQFDLFATVLRLAGQALPTRTSAKSLLDSEGKPCVEGHRTAFSYATRVSDDSAKWSVAAAQGEARLVRIFAGSGVEKVDLTEDPSGERPWMTTDETQCALAEMLDAEMARTQALASETGGPVWVGNPAEYQRQIEALGYV